MTTEVMNSIILLRAIQSLIFLQKLILTSFIISTPSLNSQLRFFQIGYSEFIPYFANFQNLYLTVKVLTRQSTTPVYYQSGTLLCERRNSCKGGQHATSGFGIQTVSTCENTWKQYPKRRRKLLG